LKLKKVWLQHHRKIPRKNKSVLIREFAVFKKSELHVLTTKTTFDMVIDDTNGLHESITGRGANKAPSAFF